MEKIKPRSERKHIFRYYGNVYTLLREIFNLPGNEMPLNFKWDKERGELVLETIKD